MKIRVIDKEDNTNLTLYLPLFIMKFVILMIYIKSLESLKKNMEVLSLSKLKEVMEVMSK